MRALSILAGLLIVGHASARDALSDRELAELKRICADLVGTQYLSPRWERLKPYLKEPNALHSPIVCSGGCGSFISLRGGLLVNALFINPQKLDRPWGPRDGLIYQINLKRGEKTIFRLGREPKI